MLQKNNPLQVAGLEAMGPHEPVGRKISQLQMLHPAERESIFFFLKKRDTSSPAELPEFESTRYEVCQDKLQGYFIGIDDG